MKQKFSLIILLLSIIILLIGLSSCSNQNQSNNKFKSDSLNIISSNIIPVSNIRLALGKVELKDSVEVLSEGVVDIAMKEVCDSLINVKYFNLLQRDSIAKNINGSINKSGGIELSKLAKELKLGGIVFVKITRFSSVLATELKIVNPEDGSLIYRNLDFSFIRFRDSIGVKFLGPTLVESLRKAMSKLLKLPNNRNKPIATEPIVITSFEIQRDSLIKIISINREELSINIVKAIGEYGRRFYQSLMIFDYVSRNQIYKMMNSPLVQDYEAPSNFERTALFSLGIDRYIVGGIKPISKDSLEIKFGLYKIMSFNKDTLFNSVKLNFPINKFENLSYEKELISASIDVITLLYEKENLNIISNYEQQRKQYQH